MDDTPLSEEEIELLLGGASTPSGHEELAQLLADLRSVPQPQPRIGPQLGEFIDAAPTEPRYLDDIILQNEERSSESARRRFGVGTGRPLARLALASVIGLAGITGVHAAGLADVPLLPDGDESAELVFAEASSTSQAPASITTPSAEPDPAINIETSTSGDFGAEIELGEVSASISISADGDDYIVEIEVEGVSPECEAAIESISGLLGRTDLEEALQSAEAACAGELDVLGPDFGGAEGFEGMFGGIHIDLVLPEDLDELDGLFGDFDPKDFEGFLGDFDPKDFERFLGDFDPKDFEGFLDDFDPKDFEGFLDDFDPKDFERFLGDFDPKDFEGFLDDFDPEQLDGLFGEMDADHLENLLEGFGFDPDDLPPGLLPGGDD